MHIVRFFIRHNVVITLPEGVPPAVAQSFASLIPAAVAITLIWLIRVILNFDINHFFTLLLSPLVSGLGSLPGMLVLIFLISLLWCCGIHGDNVLSGITSPIFLKYIAENTQAYLHHQPIPHITADGFYIVFMCWAERARPWGWSLPCCVPAVGCTNQWVSSPCPPRYFVLTNLSFSVAR